MAVQVRQFTFNPLQENTYLVMRGSQALVVDPGCYTPAEQQQLQAAVDQEGLTVVAVVNTHCHLDHVLGNAWAQRTFGVPLYIPEGEEDVLRSAEVFAPMWGLQAYEPAQPDGRLAADKPLPAELADWPLQLRLVPGHSPAHLVLYFPEDGFLLGGDVLFQRSIGRTDLPGGDHDTLLHSIRQQVYTLPKATQVWPGHGPPTTVGEEMMHNPFCPAL